MNVGTGTIGVSSLRFNANLREMCFGSFETKQILIELDR